MAVKTVRPRVFRGILASPGIAIGKAHVLNKFHLCIVRHKIEKENIKHEIDRFYSALEATKNDMIEAAEKNLKKAGAKISYILNPHIQLLNDPALVNQTKEIIENEQVNAEWALKKTYDKFSARFHKIKDPYFKDRVQDIELVVNRVSQRMMGAQPDSVGQIAGPIIYFAHALTPFDTAQMAMQKVLGFVTEVGGKTSHTGIIASSLQIPAVVGVHKITSVVQTGDNVILDAIEGRVVLNPSEEQFRVYNNRRQKFLYLGKELEADPKSPAITKDGVEVRIMANIETADDIKTALSLGAEGVGLYRTEFFFLGGGKFPDEEKQYLDYRRLTESVAPNEAIIRTLDLGGDKLAADWEEEPEINPALGLRAIRYCLDNPQVFRTQLRAILRASHYGKIKMMYPMVIGVDELRKANRFLDKQKRELKAQNIAFDPKLEVGIMIETPSAALMVHHLAPHVDFFSIGTNDLIQYMLAIDRGNERVAHLYEPLHPAVIHMLYMIIQTANRYNVPVSICGQMSADPVYAYILLGMGKLDDLSMDSHSIPKVKKFLKNISVADARKHVSKIMQFSRIRDIKRYLNSHVVPHIPEGMFSEINVETYGRKPLA